MKVKGLMSCRQRLDHFKDVAFLLGWSEKLRTHLSPCENPRLKLESALIAFGYYTVGRLLIFPLAIPYKWIRARGCQNVTKKVKKSS